MTESEFRGLLARMVEGVILGICISIMAILIFIVLTRGFCG